MKSYLNEQVIRMLKNGADPTTIQETIAEAGSVKEYSFVFVDFMQDMLDKYKVKRTDIARATGLSQDYLYKVLNGQKKTAEKDYVLAICIAIGMNIPETQHALEICGMHILNSRDLREHILLTSISEKRGVYRTNEWLESAGFPMLRVSRDMPQYAPNYTYQEEEPVTANTRKRYQEVSREVFAEPCGNAPFDYTYWANIVVSDEADNRYHVQGYYAPDFTAYSVIDEENYRKHKKWYKKHKETDTEEEYPWKTLETFATLEEAYDSDFFRFYMEIDRITDQKVEETLNKILDTANYGTRCNLKFGNKGTVRYAETYDAQDPAKHQYFQVVETDDSVTYSASHESVFMWIELESLYPSIFGEREEPQYFMKAENDEELMEIPTRERFILQSLRTQMHAELTYLTGDLSGVSEEELDNEIMNSTAQHASWLYMSGDKQGALQENLELLQMADAHEEKFGTDETPTRIVTMNKIAICYENLDDEENYWRYREMIMAAKEKIYALLQKDKQQMKGAVSCYVDTLVDYGSRLFAEGRLDEEKVYRKEAIDLLESDENCFGKPYVLFQLYTRYSYILDEENNSEEGLEYYEKAEQLIRKYHLESSEDTKNIMIFYNNYAWVLWNRFENEEAIIYYGKAIDMAENLIERNADTAGDAAAALQRYADGLHKLYEQTGKQKEMERLEKRLAKYNISFE